MIKILFFLILASCGKNQTPEYEPFQQVGEAEESSNQIDKISHSDTTTEREVNGILILKNSSQNIPNEIISFTNKIDIKNLGLEILTENPNNLKNKEISYFSDTLILDTRMTHSPTNSNHEFELKIIPENYYSKLSFYLNTKDEKINFNYDGNGFLLKSNAQIITDIISGKNTLQIARSTQERKVSQLFIFNNGDGKIFNIDDKNRRNEILTKYQINHAYAIEDFDLFLNENTLKEDIWLTRKTPYHYEIFFKGNLRELGEFYKKNLINEEFSIQRINGAISNQKILTKPEKAKIFLTIEGRKEIISFKTIKKNKSYQVPKAFNNKVTFNTNKCIQTHRSIDSKKTTSISFQDLIDSLLIQTNLGNLDITKADSIKETKLKDGSSRWILSFKDQIKFLKFSLNPLSKNSFVPIGLIGEKCQKRPKSPDKLSRQLINPESKLNVSISSYVEKIKD